MNFCTLFNSNYLTRGLALYHSLLKTTKDFHLYIFTFDEQTFQILSKIKLEHVTLISIQDFETPELLAIKSSRNAGEYCWTCTPATILYCLDKFQLANICYLDADLYFWRDPQELLIEAAHAAVLLTEHRYSPEYDHSALSGKYCVQCMDIKNNENGLKALNWWKEACIDWCYDRVEDGKFGDQKYLDDWRERFSQVVVLNHLGGGVAPWNVQQYRIVESAENAALILKDVTDRMFYLVFYHFHALKFVNNKIDLGGYRLSKQVIKHIYQPYIAELLHQEQELNKIEQISTLMKLINPQGNIIRKKNLREWLKEIKKRMLGNYHVFPVRE